MILKNKKGQNLSQKYVVLKNLLKNDIMYINKITIKIWLTVHQFLQKEWV